MNSSASSTLFVNTHPTELITFGDIFSGQSLAQKFLPDYDFRERYSVDVYAPGYRVYRVARDIDLAGSAMARLLFRLRGMSTHHQTFDKLSSVGFVRLGEQAGGELVLGAIGQFWNPNKQLQRITAEEFPDFAKDGFVKLVFNMRTVGGSRNLTRLSSETRVHCLGSGARRWFGAYWTLAKPFSAMVQREILWQVKRRAEAG